MARQQISATSYTQTENTRGSLLTVGRSPDHIRTQTPVRLVLLKVSGFDLLLKYSRTRPFMPLKMLLSLEPLATMSTRRDRLPRSAWGHFDMWEEVAQAAKLQQRTGTWTFGPHDFV